MEVALTVQEPTPIALEGRPGLRYWLHRPHAFTGNAEVDERLSGFPMLVFLPLRLARETPTVVALQGLAAPMEYNAFLVPTLLDMGIACVLVETPLAGERSLVRDGRSDIVDELAPLAERGVYPSPALVTNLMDGVARDVAEAFALVRERHGLTDDRRALFGVSLGVLLSAFAFLRDELGTRLLGAIGHADLARFAHSYRLAHPARWWGSRTGRMVGQLASPFLRSSLRAGLRFLAVLAQLTEGMGPSAEANPMTYADRAGTRPIRFLVGDADLKARVEDAQVCAARFPNGTCYVVPGMGHGGDGFVEHVRNFLGTQLGDWRW